ncbi:hypothetical protein M409DRAFT_24490 [Zasmidium cellare ATCC 36951]|uniref:F-box domain-containing protein n=1 Tax=Zasmidium cellare ATCC 36951 TaxID=1080233 RepID=A0A6A6CD37_ZASCE|nr:uncharacterized protein M409DRAFT_24490 [Zasmidium cellare ATCC 36951]KAF2165104.1 hypothetical protein M409DRAFT_24490 [Zasmidium cellare ATCC 36951]
MHAPTGLLSLPRELRDQIYPYLTTATWNPQSSLRIIPPPSSDGQLYFWPEHAKWQPIALLSVNRQLRSEVRDFIASQHKTGNVRLELDICVKGYVYTPTWTFLNFAFRPRDSLDLHVNLTLFSTEAFRRNDGWPRQPGQIFRALLNFLNRFIYRGPSFLDSDPPFETPGPHFIKTLSVDVTFQDYYTMDTWPETVHEVFRMLKALTMLNTAGRYIGRVEVRVIYSHGLRAVHRQAGWDVRPAGADATTPALFKEDDWARIGFFFGDAWLERQRVPRSFQSNVGETMLNS